jgi:hypothetical protein
MKRLNSLAEQYSRWFPLKDYTSRIEAYKESDFSLALENAKSLLEAIAKQICKEKGVELGARPGMNAILKQAFHAIGYSGSEYITQISTALATIGKNIGELRNAIGPTAHGRSLEELKSRNDSINDLTRDFLIDSVVVVACFLIKSFETDNPRSKPEEEKKILYSDNDAFNDFWDEAYGEFTMGDYAYQASEILYNVDMKAYKTEYKAFMDFLNG